MIIENEDLLNISSGYYFAKQGDSNTKIIYVNADDKRVILNFGYREEVFIYKDDPDKSDYYADVVLNGPITSDVLNPMHNPMKNKTPEERRACALKSHESRRANKAAKIAEMEATKAGQLQKQIDELEARLSELKSISTIQAAAATLTGTALLREDEISAAALSWDHSSGVYFLLDGDEIVYVGQSLNVYARISTHRTYKKFDRYAFVPCKPEMLDKLESLYIHSIRPRLNGTMKNGVKNAPISLETLLG